MSAEVYLTALLILSTSAAAQNPDKANHANCSKIGEKVKNGTKLSDMVLLRPPSNLTVSFVGSTEVLLMWYAPENVNLQDVVYNASSYNSSKLDMEMHIDGTSTVVSFGNETFHYDSLNGTLHKPEDINTTLINAPTGIHVNVSKDWNVTEETHWSRKPCDLLEEYLIFYRKGLDPDSLQELRVPANVTEIHLAHLTPGTLYTVNVQGVYTGEVKLGGKSILNFITMGYGSHRNCSCNIHGRNPLFPHCDPTKYQWCSCRLAYQGLFCEECKPGFYRVAPNFPCHRCPCSRAYSSGKCQFVRSQVHCTYCHQGYSGNLCHRCVYGFYAKIGRCERCNCHGNEDIRQPYMCSPATGQCMGCIHNTTGHHCNHCLPGYTGDAVRSKNCTLISEVEAQKEKPKVAVGIIAAVCVVIILSLSALAGLIVYRKWRHFPSMKSFWTVELRDNHESVSFNGVPDDDLSGSNAKNFDDMAFYEKQNKDSKRGKELSYAPLREDF